MPENKISWKRRLALLILALGALLFLVGISLTWVPMGSGPDEVRAQKMASSPNFSDGSFHNAQPMWNDYAGWFTSIGEASEYGSPLQPLPVIEDAFDRLQKPARGARVTWLGHSTVLIEIAGKRVLTDPIWSDGVSPLAWIGPARWYPPPLTLDQVSPVDIVLISHDHYDHLDQSTIEKMSDWDTTFVAPLGVGAHLEYWGVEPERVVEVDWWDELEFDDLRIAATPARHASGRHLLDQNRTLWAGYALIGPEHRIMFSGDTGLFDDMETIGERYGPFDVVMIEVGAYHRTWPDWHTGPEQAIKGHQMMRGEVFLPIHWGLFNLALHGWTEPIERTWAAAEKAGASFVTPRPGEPVDIAEPPAPERWWPEVPWQTAEEHPIVSTKNGDPDERY